MRLIETATLGLPLREWEAFVEEVKDGGSLTPGSVEWIEAWEEYDAFANPDRSADDTVEDALRCQRRIGHYIGWYTRGLKG